MSRTDNLSRKHLLFAWVSIVLFFNFNSAGRAAPTEKEKESDEPVVLKYDITVTATRTKKDTFEVPNIVSVTSREKIIQAAPNNISDMFSAYSGMDVVGVGANQSRPIIRGLRGQRILLMEDGLRLNNSRRQQDFGEIPGMVDISSIESVEIVKGPASVLYGSDAIGGVINIVTQMPDPNAINGIRGLLGYRFGSADNQHKAMINLNAHYERLDLILNASYRNSHDYRAPAGKFGRITLTEDVMVHDSAVEDNNLSFLGNFRLSDTSHLLFKFENYQANDAGFGYVDPQDYAPGDPLIRILYPAQQVQKYSLRYRHDDLKFVLAEVANVSLYFLKNKRDLDMNIFVPFGIPQFPNAGVSQQTKNFTDIDTLGFRLEFLKNFRKRDVLIYGVDLFRDHSENTDLNETSIIGLGPKKTFIDPTPMVPNAIFSSLGVFVQDDINLFKKANLILGARYQNTRAQAKKTFGLTDLPLNNSADQALVGSASFTYGLNDYLRAFVSVGRAFRSPNLIERFYNGPTPQGQGYQIRNLDLEPENSLNVEIGLKYRAKNFYLETAYFRNTIHDGIRVVPTNQKIAGMDAYQNINIDKLLLHGLEALGEYVTKFGLSVMANFTYITSKDLQNPALPYSDTYGTKFNFNVHYLHPTKMFWLNYDGRVNGRQKDIELISNPIGTYIPGFTVHQLSAGVTLFKKSRYPQRVGIIWSNILNTLYAEFSNASFFRPAAKSNFTLTWQTSF